MCQLVFFPFLFCKSFQSRLQFYHACIVLDCSASANPVLAMGYGRLVSTLDTAAGRAYVSLIFRGPRFATCLRPMKQVAHIWYLPCYQCMFSCLLHTKQYLHASARCKQPSGELCRPDQRIVVCSVLGCSSGANPFWQIGHGWVVSMLDTAMGGEQVSEIQVSWVHYWSQTHEARRS